MTKVYGCSDDLVEIESGRSFGEIDCFDKDVRIWFKDGTVIRVGYPKKGKAVWWIEVEEAATEAYNLTITEDEDAEIYSDIFEIDSEIDHYAVIPKRGADQ